ncbi:Lectin C-type domain-containing protein [Duganella sp. CF458]|uniref:ricin-type beta-trefoil lectin domain protein n=1 Tax=Duganella sp. CF458 TaxID=1884368 RepID=UPI0008DEDE9D|nr:ricin-type beta-trefoil lectin domain protein [Duganella sp. CF458]SFG18530.1 Lectin C-type domain-containing protein [Duganella sp. CF458]
MKLSGAIVSLLFGMQALHAADLGLGIRTQYDVAMDTPLNRIQVLGAHNAWNDSGATWANQRWPMNQLLNSGIRNIDLDLHMNNGQVQLCHQDCSAIYGAADNYPNELWKIRNWLDANPKAIVFVDLEDRANNQAGVVGPLTAVFGSLLYKPSDKPASRWESAREMIARGKRVIVKSANNTYDGTVVWQGPLFATGAAGGWNSRQVKFVNTANCTVDGAPIDQEKIYAVSDSKLGKDVLPDSWIDETGTIDGSNIPGLMRCGVDNVDADRWDEGMIASAIWSWADGEPNDYNNEDCAQMRGDGRWNDAACTTALRFACQDKERPDEWRVTPAAGVWQGGKQACAAAFGNGFAFSVPANAYMNERLRLAAGANPVWLNYSDQAEEGKWEKYDDAPTRWDTGAYGNNEDRAQTLRLPGAGAVRINIGGSLGAGDVLRVYDSNRRLLQIFSGALAHSLVVADSAIIAQLVSDAAGTSSGASVSIEALATSWNSGAYGNNEDRSQWLTIPGAAALKVYLHGSTDANRDFIQVYDRNGTLVKSLSGAIATSFMVNGDSARIRLVSDGSIAGTGVTASVKPGNAYVFRRLVDGRGKCIDIEGNNMANGTPVHHWSCQGQVTQLWYHDPDGLLRSKNNPDKCIDVYAFGTGNGSKLVVWDCNDKTNQRFSWSGQTLRPAHAPGKAVDVKDAWWGSFDGQDLHLWDYQESWGQTWHWE